MSSFKKKKKSTGKPPEQKGRACRRHIRRMPIDTSIYQSGVRKKGLVVTYGYLFREPWNIIHRTHRHLRRRNGVREHSAAPNPRVQRLGLRNVSRVFCDYGDAERVRAKLRDSDGRKNVCGATKTTQWKW
jgi:hypothetical protein